MIRIVVRISYMGHVVHGGAPAASVDFKTFDVALPEVEKFLRGTASETYVARDVVGIELLEDKQS